MKNKMLIGVLSVSVILGGAVAVGAANNGETTNDQKVTTSKEMISVEKVKEIALSKVTGHVENIELESYKGNQYYEVEVENGKKDYDLYIDAYTGEVQLMKEDSNNDDDSDDRTGVVQSTNLITDEKAKQLAEKAVNGTVTELELDEDDGRFVYELELITNKGEADVEIDAVTGKVIELNFDHEDDDDLDD
ncbi:putative membrane protein YkoI [Lysinibacillus composti]|uniref:PepSY domain-containing protein n=1 Tax=Lysinibacillus composti TaxID=720633 RepID=A0A3N9UAS3_9BACI|nr:PepSY domain-containing protein [Lysinibacillus composti]MBM7609778.1 putative membrane protein YkoI [Lysinibacillus composti]RQW73557.1 hypothetical protein EBB45_15720 [Lysinibacillus composti]